MLITHHCIVHASMQINAACALTELLVVPFTKRYSSCRVRKMTPIICLLITCSVMANLVCLCPDVLHTLPYIYIYIDPTHAEIKLSAAHTYNSCNWLEIICSGLNNQVAIYTSAHY